METTTPAANSACPPAPILPEQCLSTCLWPNCKVWWSSQFCDDHDLISLKFLAFHWKITLHPYCSPKEMQQINSNTEQALIVPKTLLRVPYLLDTGNSWLQRIESVRPPFPLWISCMLHWHNLLCMLRSAMHDDDDDTDATTATTSSCSSSKHTTHRELPMTTSLLPHIHVTDKWQPHRSSESWLCVSMPPVYWNVIYDPTNDQIQVYQNNSIRIFTRQWKSQCFVYRYGKNENTFPWNAKIAIGHWQNSYFVLLKTTLHPLVTICHQVNLDSSLTLPELSNPLPVLPRPPPNQILYHQPSPTPCNVNHLRHANRMACTCPHPAITRSPIKIALASNKSKCLPCFDTRTYMTRMLEVAKTHAQPIFWLTRWYLDMYFFSIAEVLLEQNVDPGWVHHPLVPTLKRGGMWGGGWYHNSVKTTIFNNSVNSL
jgi:hypothetical protein